MWRDKFSSVDWWAKWLSALAVPGIVANIAGSVVKSRALVGAGLVLVAPALLGGALALILGVFILIKGKDGPRSKK
jgi:hypothetical protein